MSGLRFLTYPTLLAAVLLQAGCVHRRVTINSNPQGALVRIDGQEIGYTPASVDYTWYGTREVQLVKDGYETQTQMIELTPPWYQRFPLDFVSDNFLGTHVRDHRRYDLQMRPKQPDVTSDVIERGRSLRSEATHGL
ncbi:MAG: PEGA domain-containing protein [Planctomycetaceae bacterium]